ncbi:MAG: PfkB family carbohydrate kinase [bacterium]
MKKILCLGLTPALQRTLLFDALDINEVNRAKVVIESAAGKALNTARALSVLSMPVQVAGLNGGAIGRKIDAFLKTYGVTSVQTSMKSNTRICTTLLDQRHNTITELVEEAPNPGAAALKRFMRDNLEHIIDASALVISGTLPPFVEETFYLPFVRAAQKRGIPVIIDSHKAPLLHVLSERPLLIKLNQHELAITFKREITSEQQLLSCMNELIARGAQNVVITQGAKPTYLMTSNGKHWRLTPPKLDQVINPIGSGDCTTAGIVCKLLKRRPLPEAIAFGLACGSANATTQTPADFAPRHAQVLRKHVLIEALV